MSFWPVDSRLTLLFVNQHAGSSEFRWASLRPCSNGKKINVKQIDYTYFIKFWFNEFIIKPFSSRLIQFGPSLVAYCLRSWECWRPCATFSCSQQIVVTWVIVLWCSVYTLPKDNPGHLHVLGKGKSCTWLLWKALKWWFYIQTEGKSAVSEIWPKLLSESDQMGFVFSGIVYLKALFEW